MRLFVLTPAAGKRLIGRAIAQHPAVRAALASNTVVIVAGTTNGYVAEEILKTLGRGQGPASMRDQARTEAQALPRSETDDPFCRRRFFRGITLPPNHPAALRPAGGPGFPGDAVIERGAWQPGRTIFDVADTLVEGDVIIKGANALDLARRRAAVLVGHPQGGTIGAAARAAIGRRVRLILPVGLEKRVPGDLDELAARINAPGEQGPRLWPAPGEVFTEIEALALLTGATAEPAAAGGVSGAEGCVWLGVEGDARQLEAADRLLHEIAAEPPFEVDFEVDADAP